MRSDGSIAVKTGSELRRDGLAMVRFPRHAHAITNRKPGALQEIPLTPKHSATNTWSGQEMPRNLSVKFSTVLTDAACLAKVELIEVSVADVARGPAYFHIVCSRVPFLASS
jgi:hypothetical protein